jgi:hypothetical protein
MIVLLERVREETFRRDAQRSAGECGYRRGIEWLKHVPMGIGYPNRHGRAVTAV